jgi:regulatory protein
MAKITSIEYPAGWKQVGIIRVDDDLELQAVGQDVDPEALRQTVNQTEEFRAKESCLRKLAARSRSRQELVRHLEQNGFEAEVIRRVLDRLQSVNLVNDEAFSEAFIRDRLRSGAHSRRALQAELQQRGVDRNLAAASVDQELPGNEADACRTLAEQKAGQYRRLERPVARRRLAAFLGRRGFAAEDVFKTVDLVLPEEE